MWSHKTHRWSALLLSIIFDGDFVITKRFVSYRFVPYELCRVDCNKIHCSRPDSIFRVDVDLAFNSVFFYNCNNNKFTDNKNKSNALKSWRI